MMTPESVRAHAGRRPGIASNDDLAIGARRADGSTSRWKDPLSDLIWRVRAKGFADGRSTSPCGRPKKPTGERHEPGSPGVQDDVGGGEAVATASVSVPRSAGERLEDMYRAHRQAGMRLSYVLTGERAAAEDLFHDAFLKASWHVGNLRDPAAFGSYLRRTIINQQSSRRRRRRLERECLQKAAVDVPSEASQPDVALHEDLWQLLLGLPPRWRAVLYLRFYEDLSEGDTADVLACSRQAVRALTHRAISALRIDYRGDEG